MFFFFKLFGYGHKFEICFDYFLLKTKILNIFIILYLNFFLLLVANFQRYISLIFTCYHLTLVLVIQ
jgi:hypothetical protein